MKKGELGTKTLNRELQDLLNPFDAMKNEMKFGDKIFREDDKIIQLKNNYDKRK